MRDTREARHDTSVLAGLCRRRASINELSFGGGEEESDARLHLVAMQLCVLLVSASVCFYFKGSYRCEQLWYVITHLLIARLHSRSVTPWHEMQLEGRKWFPTKETGLTNSHYTAVLRCF